MPGLANPDGVHRLKGMEQRDFAIYPARDHAGVR
jgi:hypothetical protein